MSHHLNNCGYPSEPCSCPREMARLEREEAQRYEADKRRPTPQESPEPPAICRLCGQNTDDYRDPTGEGESNE